MWSALDSTTSLWIILARWSNNCQQHTEICSNCVLGFISLIQFHHQSATTGKKKKAFISLSVLFSCRVYCTEVSWTVSLRHWRRKEWLVCIKDSAPPTSASDLIPSFLCFSGMSYALYTTATANVIACISKISTDVSLISRLKKQSSTKVWKALAIFWI